jgi:hypothetical protein
MIGLRPALLIALAPVLVLVPAAPAGSAPAVARPGAAATVVDVSNTLRVLDRLHSFGYVIDTPARADRAIRHWQKVNGLEVDGIVGTQTLASLDMTVGAAASAPAARTTPPPAPAADARLPETIVRDIWPDDIEDRAVAIAWRESRLQPDARNACCYGLFQINYRAHRAWLGGLGVTTAADLLDPATNARAALALYQAAGWGPWSL